MKATLTTTRRELLTLLKRRGPMPADELAEALGVSGVAVRQHLDVLEAEGLVATSVERRRVGRPRHLFAVTEAAEGFFPKNYAQFAKALLEQIAAEEGPRRVIDLLEGRRQRLMAEQLPLLEGHDLESRLETLTQIQDDAGYMPEWQKLGDDLYELREHNCALCCVARAFPQLCQKEQEFFAGLLDAEVTREQHMLKGDRMCSFVIRPHPASRGTEGSV